MESVRTRGAQAEIHRAGVDVVPQLQEGIGHVPNDIQIRSRHSIGMVWREEEGEIQFECMLVIYYNYDLLSKVRSTYTF